MALSRRSILRSMLAMPAIAAAPNLMRAHTPRWPRPRPLAAGYLKNIAPIEAVPGEYVLNNGPIEAVRAVYANGQLLDPSRYVADLERGVVRTFVDGLVTVDFDAPMTPGPAELTARFNVDITQPPPPEWQVSPSYGLHPGFVMGYWCPDQDSNLGPCR